MTYCEEGIHKLTKGEEYTEILENYVCKKHTAQALNEFRFECKNCGCWYMEREWAIEGCGEHECDKCMLKKLTKAKIRKEMKNIKFKKWVI